jgi:hypothetical protein
MNGEQPNYYAIIPATVRYADITPNAKLLYGEITALCSKEGFCWASNEYFAKLYSASERSVSRWVTELVELGVLRLVMVGKNSRKLYLEGQKRLSLIDKNVVPDRQKLLHSITDTNTYNLSVASAPLEIVSDSEESTRPAKAPKYPNARTAFSWFRKQQPSWNINTTELKHGELLFQRGEEKVKSMLDFIREYQDEDFFPSVTKPSDLERKWNDLAKKRKKMGV